MVPFCGGRVYCFRRGGEDLSRNSARSQCFNWRLSGWINRSKRPERLGRFGVVDVLKMKRENKGKEFRRKLSGRLGDPENYTCGTDCSVQH